ncbi:non-ribosomal peptide synthetase [Streptomyces humidus]|nr:non-ribosomal peptide synthetase [Streptomyces humidus]
MSSADVAAATRLPGARHTIVRLYESTVEAHPDAPAITDGSRSWSYRELNAAANRVAWWLIGRGVGPERTVGVALPRGLDQIAALLGTLKAGAVYLPLDPVLPAERIGYLLGDATPSLVLTDGTGTGFPGAVDIGDRSLVAEWAACPEDDPGDDDRAHALTADHLAYVIYTSGSTGTPKGVGVSHGSAVNLARTVAGQYAPGDTPRVLQLASLGFDVAIWELLTAVATGGTLVVPRAGQLVGDDLLRVLREERITCVTLPVPLLASLPQDAENRLPDLNTVHIGGETCPPELVRRWSTGRRLINGYGATETTVAATLTAPLTGAPALIGTPIEHTRVHVLDDALTHLAPGQPGELYVAGANVARGYLRRPGLTATRFLPDPYGPPGARMYRTGDVGVRHPDGQLEFLRRADDQVKIRGARVEPGELEAVLRRRADIVDAAVAVRADPHGEPRLVAYVVPSPAGTTSVAGLRDELRATLPPSLVPASVVPLDSLPLTPNGKVDRDSLPDPRHIPAGLRRTARSPLEDMLRTLFAEILQLPQTGFDDDFFDLGGHSLLAGRLIGRIRGALGLDVDMRDFFERPTPAGLAAHLQRQEAGPARAELTPLPRPERIPLSFAQARLWFLHRLEGPSATYNMPLALHLTGAVDTAALAAALADVVRRHEPLRTLFPETGGQPYQQITDPDEVRPDLPVRRIDPADLDEELRRSARYAFDLARELPVRAELLVLGPDESVLTLVIHHIAGDGWSGAPLARDLVTAYAARRDGTAPQWPPLPVQYADHTLWQRALLGDENDPAGLLNEQLRYWREQLAGLPDEITVPGDRPRPAVATYRGGVVPVTLDAELHAAVTELARGNGATVYMVLQATLAALLTRLGAGTDIAIGAGVAGRSEPALDDLVGLFVNMLVLRTDTSGSPGFAELLDRVRDTSLAAYSRQDIPFEQLVESLNPHRRAGRQSLFQVALVLQNNTSVPFDLPGLRVRAETVPTGTARFDLSLSVTESTTPDGAPAGIGGTVEYAADLYDRPTVQAVVERWIQLIRQVVADPGRRIDTLDVTTPDDASRLAGWRRYDGDVEPLTFSDLFERQAEATPGAVAVSDGADTWTYAELNRHANRIAGRLIDRGIGPEDLVGVAMPRSARLVAALLGVLKAGAAYVPVDLVFPAGRNRHVITDSAPRLVLTSRAGAEDLPGDLTCDLVMVDEDGFLHGRPGRDDNPTDHDRVRPVDVDNPAYVIYTSGSTGRPKGVVVTHRGLAAFAETLRQRCAADRDSRVLQLSSPSVDASVLEMVWAFSSGARLVIAGRHRLAGDELAQALTEHRITHAHIPPSALSTLAPETAGRLPEFRMLSVGAEACPPELVELWLPGRRFVNAYGPTECTVAASHTFPLAEARAPIGKPVLDAELHVLDETLRPAAPGVPGELYIGGAGLARGYLGRSGLTASRFVANPFGAPGARMYRTGDVVRWNADGELEYLGRSDEQVKIRGFRVEPGEIERVLVSQPSVERAVVVPRRDRSGAVSLAAYTVLAAEATSEGFDDQLSEWNDLYDQVYTGFSGDAGNDFVGWNSSFTGGPIPVEEMRAWQRAAVDAVLRFGPGRVLEIGAGSGLLMSPLADEVEEYWGTDLSQVSTDRLREFARGRGWDHVRLSCQAAHDLSGLPRRRFDTVVVNSVVQYFPSADYLRDVLTRVMDLLADGGRVIVGDVRHYGLLRVFQTAVHDFRGTPGARAAVERAIAVEKELLLAPEFFTSFEHPALSGVEVSLKAGGASTELSGYRYEVVLHTAPARRLADLPELVWGRDITDVDQLTGPARVTQIPNPRLAGGIAAIRALDGADAVPTPPGPELEPETVRRWAAARGMRAVPTWSSRRWNTYDVVLTDAAEAEPLDGVYRPAEGVEQANVPAVARTVGELVSELRSTLKGLLPDYMVPATINPIERIPVTPNGKIDRRALPDPEVIVPDGRRPRTPQEQILCELFADILGLERVGVDDSFFDLGGHSLLATRLTSRIRSVLGVEVLLRQIFAAPSPAELAVVLGEGEGRVQVALERVPRPEVLPLSSAQRRLWFLHRLEGPSATYNSPLAIRLSGALDVVALRAALGDVVGRHEALRTVFAESDGVPCQRIVETVEVALPVREVSEGDLPGALREAARHAFDLSREIPLRAELFTTGHDSWVLLLVVHHIAADGWSSGPLARDLTTAYAGRRAGRAPSWRPLPVQYADYTLWQRRILGDESDPDSVIGRQLDYWRGQLAGLPEQVTLPADRVRPQSASYAGDVCMFRVDTELHAGLVALARRSGATLFMVLQAALAAVLTRSGAGTDVPIGSPVAGRTDEALDDLVGFFVNTLVLRTDTSGNPGFDELLRRVRDTSLAAYAHQDVPFEFLVEKLNPQRSTAHSPLFQVLLAFQNNPETGFGLPGLRTRMEGVSTGLSRVDLFISLAEQQDSDHSDHSDGAAGVVGAVEYATDLYDAATIEAFIGRWLRFLAAVARDQEQRIGSVDLLLDGERDLLTSWAYTEPTVRPATLTQLFERRVAATPDATAVVEGESSWSYAQLNAHANRVAWHLIGRGVGAEDVVGVLMPRSATQIAVLLGIGKAGAAYLPIDPAYPQARVEHLLRDAGPALVIDGSDLFEDRPEDDPADRDRVRPVDVDNPAYVIYTSGSTGLPKGVVVTHRGLAALAAGTGERTGVDSDSRVLLLASPSFDASVLELMMAVGAGAALVVAREMRPAGEELAGLLAGAGVSHAFVPPSVLATLPEGAARGLSGLRSLVVGGEACSAELVRRWSVGRRMTNLYGPTETTVAASVSRPLSGGAHPIGAPLAGTRVYVLDGGLGLAPRGSRGELYIAGAGVARGYLGRFGLTASRFVADPYGPPGSRMYRTGDVVRWNADGELEYLGRSDDQVKIRGIRVEPGETEAALAAHPDVARAVVVVRRDRRGEPALIGYMVPARPGADPGTVREDLSRLLPDHLVPAALVALPEFPLTPNGKLDHEALPEPEFETSGGRDPRTPEEEILCGLFAEILGADRVGVEDSFFDLGGHSLLGTRLISRIRAELGIEVRLLTLFEASTPAALARAILEANSPARGPLVPAPRPQVLPLSFAQQRLWFLHKLEGPSPTYNMPLTLRLTGPLRAPALREALADVIARHEALRTVFAEHDGEPCQRILDMAEVTVPLPVREADGAALDEAVRDAARHRFDLAAEIPLRASLFAVGHDEWVLMLVLHHIVADGWSLRPLARDLATAYAAREAGRAPDWSPLPVQYADYSLWHRELLGDDTDPGSEFGRQLAFWRERLAGLPEQVTLPSDRPRPAVAGYRGDVSTFQVDAALHAELTALARQTGSTLFMVLQTALSALLTRSGAGTDVVVGAGVAGRTDEQLDDLVGFFVNMVVLRTDTSDDPAFTELLQRVRDTSLAAYAHQDIPFEYLVEKINPLRSASHQSLFQIAMVLQNNAEADFTLSDLRVRQEGQGTGTSRFDLSLSITETTSADGGAAGLTGVVEFSTDLYDRSTIEAFTARWVRVLRAMVVAPGSRLSEVDLLGVEERVRLLEEWGSAGADVDAVTLAELFGRRVAVAPDAVAVVEGEVSWSYARLNAYANRVAWYLIGRGVGAEDVVGVVLPRGVGQIAAVLGVGKAGAAFLPVDPSYPRARVEYLLRDAAPVVVIGGSEVFEGLPEHDPGDGDRVRAVGVDHPAYVIYTSGSTGLPKGVVVTHRGLTSLAATLRQRCAADGDSRIMQFSSPGFDAAVLELVWALDSGAALVIASADRLAGEELARALAEHRITHALIPPSVLSTLPPEAPRTLTGFRTLIVGAEACPPELLRAWSPGRRMVNAYGPTESTVVASQTGDLNEPPVPIGTPALNTRLYVLDESLGLVAPGVPGELYIAGEGLARGYGRRPALTASRFLADPYGPAGTRMYRTGDLVRWNADGQLEYLGRTDEQVKIRGFRVEPGEVERVLAAQSSVARAVVVPRQDHSGALSLAAYVVPADGATTADVDEQLDDWRSVYHEVYRGLPREPGADFEGWNSSFTGAPIPIDQMREWQRSAVDQVARFGPRRVLEIGAGSGLVMIPLVERTEEYWATDFSAAAVDRLREYAREQHWEHVHLRCRPAHDVSELPRAHFDTIVLNSVVQYFPSADYLRDVLGKAVDLLADGGRIIVGDVRHHGLLRALHTAVQRFRHPGSRASAVDHAVSVEKELLLAPEFFTAFRHPRLTGVEVLLKRGDADNELTAYRYEVVLHTAAARPVGDLPELLWGRDVTDLDELTAPARVTGIPNPRLADPADPRLHPERIRRWAAGHGWRAVPTWSQRSRDTYDAVLLPDTGDDAPLADVYRPGSPEAVANVPSLARNAGEFVSGLRAAVKALLPDHMVPATITPIERIPLTPNGKIDRRALPEPEVMTTGAEDRGPRNPYEEILCELFADLLGLPRVDVDDGFFDLGGHSLLATRLTSRIRAVLGIEAPLRQVFAASSPARLAAVLAQGADPDGTVPALVPGPRPEALPLSFAQRRLWFLHKLEGPSATYNSPLAIRLSGPLDVAALRSALGDVVARHEALRTVFAERRGVPHQRILDAGDIDLPVCEVSEDDLPRVLGEASRHAFDLAREIPLRARLFTTGPDERVLLLVVHHIAADGWSLRPLTRDLTTAYEERAAGRAPSWAPLPVQYADYALWQRRMLGDDTDPDSRISRQLAHWRERLAGLPRLVTLPTDRPRPEEAGHQGATLTRTLDADLHQALRALARRNGATLFMTLQAALGAQLTRSGAGTDIPVGAPIAGRVDEALDDLIGFFVNTLVLRVDTSGAPSFVQLLERVRDAGLAAYAHQDIPFDHLVEKLNPDRSPAHHPLFQVQLALQNTPEAEFELAGLTARPQLDGVETGVARVDLTVNAVETFDDRGAPAGLVLAVEYATGLYDRATIDGFLDAFGTLLREVADSPHQPIGGLDVTSGAEVKGAEPVPGTLPWLFETWATADPSAIAVTDGATDLTYAELNSRANRMARALIDRGVGPEDLVAVLLPRGVPQVVTVLAIAKSGAAYLPVDPAYPADRVAYLCADARPGLVVTDASGAARLGARQPVFDIDDPATAERRESLPDTNPTDRDRSAALGPHHPAYVIYTSGSTGRPKGAVITHAGLADAAEAWRDRWGFGPGSRVLQLSSPGFDASVMDLVVTFAAHGTLVLPEPGLLAGEALARVLAEQRITHLVTLPSVLASLPADAPGRLTELRGLLLGGEVLTPGLAARWSPGRRMVNVYGQTETTVACTMTDPLNVADGAPVTVGRPNPGMRVYVLDEALRTVPPGTEGELYVAGPAVGRGYLHRPGLTAGRFVADPYGPAGSRMYRTGDIGRLNHTFELEYVGRTDDQVKIRGMRVEPGEVEAALAKHPAVARAAVAVRADRQGDAALFGYVVPARPDADVTGVREDLRRSLPEHLVPAAVMAVVDFPLTPNGKVDREALPTPPVAAPMGRGPRTPQEEILCGLFAEVLNLGQIGVEDNFFDLGGHSLLANQLIARIAEVMGTEVPIRAFFAGPTVAQLAAHLGSDGADRAFDVLLPLRTGGTLPPLFCVHPGAAICWSYSDLLLRLSPDFPVYGLQSRALSHPDELPETLIEVADHCIEEMRQVQKTGPYYLLGQSFGGVVAHAMAARLEAAGEQVGLIVALDSEPARPLTEEEQQQVVEATAKVYTGILEVLGIDPESLPSGKLTFAQFSELARTTNTVLGNVAEDEFQLLMEILHRNITIATRHRPERVDADMLIFGATEERERVLDPEVWRDFVAGEITYHPVPTGHSTIMTPEALGVIGPVLEEHLRAVIARNATTKEEN